MRVFLQNLKNEFNVNDQSFYKIILMGLVVVLTLLISFFSKYLVFVAFGVAVVCLMIIKGVKKVYLLVFLYPFYSFASN